MKFLCDGCERLVAASSVRTEGDALFLRCAKCGADNAVELESATKSPVLTAAPPPGPAYSRPGVTPTPSPLSAPLPAAPPPPPSRVSLRRVEDAVRLAQEAASDDDPFRVPDDRCPKCVGERPEGALSCRHCGLVYVNYRPEETAPSPELAAAFREALAAWDDPAKHEHVLALATRLGELPQVGRLYRLRLAAAPLDPMSQRGRDEVLRRAAAASEVLRSAEAKSSGTPGWQYALVGILGLGVALLAITVLRQLF